MLNNNIELKSGQRVFSHWNESEYTNFIISIERNTLKELCVKLSELVSWQGFPSSTRPNGKDLRRETLEQWALAMWKGESGPMPVPGYMLQSEPQILNQIDRVTDPDLVPDVKGESNIPEIDEQPEPEFEGLDSDPSSAIDAASHLQAAISALCGQAKAGATKEQLSELRDQIHSVQDSVNRAADWTNTVRADLNDQIDQLSRKVDRLAKDTDTQLKALQEALQRSTRTVHFVIGERTITASGLRHQGFDDLCADLISFKNADRVKDANFWLRGPAGTGKTTAAKKIAELMELPFRFNGCIDSEYKLRGFIDAQGRIISTPFRMAYQFGGIYLFDEVDSSLPAACLAFNAALANGSYDFPQTDGLNLPIPRHQDCFVLAASNTYNGPSGQYVGRFQQDGAFLDRFMLVDWDTDEKLESALCVRKDWCQYVQKVRKAIAAHGIEAIVSPRATFNGDCMLANNRPWERAVQLCVRKGINEADWQKITAEIGKN